MMTRATLRLCVVNMVSHATLTGSMSGSLRSRPDRPWRRPDAMQDMMHLTGCVPDMWMRAV